jgi:putative ABC transport system permease protein
MMAGRYKPIEVIKGGYRRRSKMVFSKVFIVLQNALAVFLIAMALIMEAQYQTSLNRPLHANTKNLVLVSAMATGNMEVLETSLAQLPFVQEMGRASNAPLAHNQGQYSQTRDGQDILYWYFKVDTTAFRMLGFEVLKDYHTPVIGGVWFCETAFNATGFTDDDLSCEVLAKRTGNDCDHVAGIIADFVTEPSNMGAVEPAIVTIVPEEKLEGNYLLKLSDEGPEIRAQIQETLDNWKTTTQVYWLGTTYVEDRLHEGLRPAQNNMRLLEIFMVLAVIISLLGLVAMSTYYADEKSRDIAVRKVFGGTVESELWRSVRDYMIMVGIACIIGIPVAIWTAGKYLEGFTVKLEHYGWLFVVAAVISVAFAFASVLWQTLKAAKTNPAVELKKE